MARGYFDSGRRIMFQLRDTDKDFDMYVDVYKNKYLRTLYGIERVEPRPAFAGQLFESIDAYTQYLTEKNIIRYGQMVSVGNDLEFYEAAMVVSRKGDIDFLATEDEIDDAVNEMIDEFGLFDYDLAVRIRQSRAITESWTDYSSAKGNTQISFLPWLSVTGSLYYKFKGCTALLAVPRIVTSKNTSIAGAFQNCNSLVTIAPMNLLKVTTASLAFDGCTSLRNITIDSNTISVDIDLSDCAELTDESVESLIAALRSVDGKVISLHTAVKVRLTEEQQTAITDKGWTIA